MQTLKRGWTLIEKPPLSTGWEKLEPPSQEHVEADEELRRLVGNESILEFVKVSHGQSSLFLSISLFPLCHHVPGQVRELVLTASSQSWIEVATGLKARNFSGEGALMR